MRHGNINLLGIMVGSVAVVINKLSTVNQNLQRSYVVGLWVECARHLCYVSYDTDLNVSVDMLQEHAKRAFSFLLFFPIISVSPKNLFLLG